MVITKEIIDECNNLTLDNPVLSVKEGTITMVKDNPHDCGCDHCIIRHNKLCDFTRCKINDQLVHYEFASKPISADEASFEDPLF